MTDVWTRGEFAHYFLAAIDAPKNRNTMLAMMSWVQAEGDAARFNPLNTVLRTKNSWDFNWVGVQNYAYFKEGVWANVHTLQYGARRNIYGYRPIKRGLRQSLSPRTVLTAVEQSAWGTGGLALRVYESTPDAEILDYRHKPIVQ